VEGRQRLYLRIRMEGKGENKKGKDEGERGDKTLFKG